MVLSARSDLWWWRWRWWPTDSTPAGGAMQTRIPLRMVVEALGPVRYVGQRGKASEGQTCRSWRDPTRTKLCQHSSAVRSSCCCQPHAESFDLWPRTRTAASVPYSHKPLLTVFRYGRLPRRKPRATSPQVSAPVTVMLGSGHHSGHCGAHGCACVCVCVCVCMCVGKAQGERA